jgi:hypothetical protein
MATCNGFFHCDFNKDSALLFYCTIFQFKKVKKLAKSFLIVIPGNRRFHRIKRVPKRLSLILMIVRQLFILHICFSRIHLKAPISDRAQRDVNENSIESFFPRFSLKIEDSIIILAQQDLSLADSGPFYIYHQSDLQRFSKEQK